LFESEVFAMKQNPETKKLEDLYNRHFVPEEIDENDENVSLLQPSPLKYVDSFTTYGISDDLLIYKGNR